MADRMSLWTGLPQGYIQGYKLSWDIAYDDHDYSNSDNNYVDPRLLTGACGPGGDDAPP